MRLVDDDRVVGAQLAVRVDLGQQDAVGHHLDARTRRASRPGSGSCGRRSPWARPAAPCARRLARLRAAMRRGCVQPISPAAPRFSARQILGICVVLPEPVSPQTIIDRVPRDQRRDVVALLRDRQVLGKARLRQRGQPRVVALARALDQLVQQRTLPARGPRPGARARAAARRGRRSSGGPRRGCRRGGLRRSRSWRRELARCRYFTCPRVSVRFTAAEPQRPRRTRAPPSGAG